MPASWSECGPSHCEKARHPGLYVQADEIGGLHRAATSPGDEDPVSMFITNEGDKSLAYLCRKSGANARSTAKWFCLVETG
jgi:hypothetical protein